VEAGDEKGVEGSLEVGRMEDWKEGSWDGEKWKVRGVRKLEGVGN
jgi:hypothetical protein